MPKINIDYSNTIIYKITCKDTLCKEVYVGHTTNFVQRKHSHKQSCKNDKSENYNCKLYQTIRNHGGWENWIMEIINYVNCKDHFEAKQKKNEYIDLLNATLNSIQLQPKLKEPITQIENTKIEYHCEPCNIIISNQKLLEAHNKTKKHNKNITTHNNDFSPEIPKKNICKICNYTCINIGNFKKHILTQKHKKKCSIIKEEQNELLMNQLIQQNMTLVSQNNEFKKMMIEQNNKLIEIVAKPSTINNNTCNNKFNINVFLNEKCKDAMNITDFVTSLKLTLQDLEKTGEIGYVKGITNIILNGLNKLDIHKRPIHCSDLKRETLYIKDNDAWEKENPDKKKIKNAIKHISSINAKQVCAWTREKENKGYDDYTNKKNDKYMKIISEANGGEDDEINKIISNIAPKIIIEKE